MRCNPVWFVLLLVGLAAVHAQPPMAAGHDTVSGYRLRLLGVFDAEAGSALSGVEVTNVQTGVSAPTNASGLVRLLFLPDGGGLVRIRKLGYTPVTRFIAISPTDTAPVTELLAKAVPTLPGVTTSDSSPAYHSMLLRRFEERRLSRDGWGHFLSEAELRKKDNFAFTTVVRELPGLMVQCTPRYPYRCGAVSMRHSPPCPVDVYLDGLATSETDLTRMETETFGGVEFYASSLDAPVQYARGGKACGVLLLWTRER